MSGCPLNSGLIVNLIQNVCSMLMSVASFFLFRYQCRPLLQGVRVHFKQKAVHVEEFWIHYTNFMVENTSEI